MKIQSIIRYLDEFIEKNNINELNPVDANSKLAKKGLLKDSDSRPGKPLRDLLRKGKIPHAYQPGGKGTGWLIPHSGKTSTQSHEFQNLKSQNTSKKKDNFDVDTNGLEGLSMGHAEIDKRLMHENNFQTIEAIEKSVPNTPGLYSLRIKNIENLPAPFDQFITERGHNIIYIGIASKSLHRRMLNQELRAKGHGTFFRSTGAMLGYRPPAGLLIPRKNKRNYTFSSADKQKIIAWINTNLLVNWIEISEGLNAIETELISKYKPLLNIAKNPAALPLISKMRKECVEIANSH